MAGRCVVSAFRFARPIEKFRRGNKSTLVKCNIVLLWKNYHDREDFVAQTSCLPLARLPRSGGGSLRYLIFVEGSCLKPTSVEVNVLLKKSLSSIVAVFALFGVTDAVAGGAWTRKQNSFYAKLGFSAISTNQFYTKDGNKIRTADFQAWSLDLYGEYGVLNQLTAVIKFPVVKRAVFETSEAKLGIGDVSLELKYGISSGNTPVAIGLGIELPTGDQNGFGRLKDQANNPGGFIRLPTGDGEFNTRVTLYLAHSFHPIPAYVAIDGGYNFRTKNFTNEYAFALQAGYKFANKIWLQANLRGLGPATDPDPELALNAALGLGEGVQYASYGFGAAYEFIPRYSVTFDFFSAFGKIANIYSGANFVVGMSVEY